MKWPWGCKHSYCHGYNLAVKESNIDYVKVVQHTRITAWLCKRCGKSFVKVYE